MMKARSNRLAESADPKQTTRMTVNGEDVERDVSVRMLLSDFLRHELGLTGTHVGCEHGVCGACTVMIDGRAGRSCLTFAVQADGEVVGSLRQALPPEGPVGGHRRDQELARAGGLAQLDAQRLRGDPAVEEQRAGDGHGGLEHDALFLGPAFEDEGRRDEPLLQRQQPQAPRAGIAAQDEAPRGRGRVRDRSDGAPSGERRSFLFYRSVGVLRVPLRTLR